jgi:hypothetical protein
VVTLSHTELVSLSEYDVLYLEVTEAMPLTQHDLCMSVLQELRSRCNVELVVDDSGAGYSNLKRILDLQLSSYPPREPSRTRAPRSVRDAEGFDGQWRRA